MNKIISKKIWNNAILDSEIIREMESVKEKDPGVDINLGCNEDNWSSLMIAVLFDRKDLVEYLFLTYPNINVNHRNYYGNTALHFCRHISILKLLLSRRDLDVNIQNDDLGYTGLHYNWNIELIRELLLDARINTSICDNKGETARDIAMMYKCYNIAKIMSNSEYTTLLRIPNSALIHDIVRMLIEEYT